jgi:lipoprotein
MRLVKILSFACAVSLLAVSVTACGKGKVSVNAENSKEAVKPANVEIKEALNKMYESGGMTLTRIDKNTTITTIYDNSGQAYVQSGYTAGVYLLGDKLLTVKEGVDGGNPKFVLTDDISPARMVEVACDFADKGGASLTETTETGKESKDTSERSFEIAVSGSNIYELYKSVSKGYAENILPLYSYKNSDEFVDGDKFVVGISTTENNLSLDMYVVSHNAPNERVHIVGFDGYVPLGGWSLDSSINSEMDLSDYDGIKEKLQAMQNDLSEKIQKYVAEHEDELLASEATAETNVGKESVDSSESANESSVESESDESAESSLSEGLESTAESTEISDTSEQESKN